MLEDLDIDVLEMKEVIANDLNVEIESSDAEDPPRIDDDEHLYTKYSYSKLKTVNKYCVNFNILALQDKLDPVIVRAVLYLTMLPDPLGSQMTLGCMPISWSLSVVSDHTIQDVHDT